MGNRDLRAARTYHDLTKHSPESVRGSQHFLDWPNQPLGFKIYEGLESVPLERDVQPSQISVFDAMGITAPAEPRMVTKAELAEIFFLSAGVTRRRRYPGGEILFRAAACTGALYHIDLYLIAGPLPDLDPGVYHFDPHDFCLTRLREGDFRRGLVQATGGAAAVAHAPAVVACASTFWRNSWKYQSRTYRHCFWDNGTILANLRAAASARQIPAKLVLGFVDSWLNELLALDVRKEASLSLVTLGHEASAVPQETVRLEPLAVSTKPLSANEVDYPLIRETHEASALETPDEVKDWHHHSVVRDPEPDAPAGQAPEFSLQSSPAEDLPRARVDEAILRRGSTRQFAREPITFRELSDILFYATRGTPGDFMLPESDALNDVYVIVNAVEGLPSGTYWFDRKKPALRQLKEGEFRREAGALGLWQEIPADASVNVYFLADLEKILGQLGNRGYRAAQLEASITGGNLYLAAYAQGLGASGLTFFDDAVTGFFSPHAAGKSVMFLVALGRSVKKRRPTSG